MKKIIINLDNRSYPVIIGNGLFEDPNSFWPLDNGDRTVIITNNRVGPIYLNKLCNLLNKYRIITDQIILPDGEENKSLFMLDVILTTLLQRNYDRNTVLLALGGGVIGDLTGFAAATYQRGIRIIQAPTTLLAQVDASIGGKTGINHVLGKNMIGSFYQPVSVIIDLNSLYTLSVREFSSGLAEIIKYAVAFDSIFFNWLENNLDDLLRLNPKSLIYCISHCCKLKSSIVSMDEFDKKGIRSLLNLGHTYGHAIESYLKYQKWSHGEAVSAGIMMAIQTSLYLKEFNKISDVERIKSLLKRANLPVYGPEEMNPQDYIEYMMRDKKSKFGEINLILPVSIGCAKTFLNVDHNLILSAIKDSYN